MTLEKTILRSLITNEMYSRKVLPFLKTEYFKEASEQLVFDIVRDFTLTYNELPKFDTISMEVEANSRTEAILKDSKSLVESIKNAVDEPVNFDWLVNNTEEFCKERAVYRAMVESLEIINDKNSKKEKGVIPQLLSDALAVSFDPNVGHDYLDQSEFRWNQYHKKEDRIPFGLDMMNVITDGGIPWKTLNIIMAGTGGGKTLTMCHFAADYLTQGKNVLYITLEMSESEISKRIDANLLNVDIKELTNIPKDLYTKKIANLKNKTNGRLIVKEYPTASASVINFKALLNELYLKKKFKPDVIFVDYINICSSARIKAGANVNSYSYVKAIAEELRGFGVENQCAVWSATQTNRSGFTSSDPGLENTSESFGLPATADFMMALVNTEELENLNQIMVKQLKNRYNSIATNKRFVVGIDKSKMRLYDVDASAQKNILDGPQEEPPAKTRFSGWNI